MIVLLLAVFRADVNRSLRTFASRKFNELSHNSSSVTQHNLLTIARSDKLLYAVVAGEIGLYCVGLFMIYL